MKVEKDKVVFMSYTLESVEDKEIVGQATSSEPFGYIHGHHFILPILESRIEGLSIGEHFDFQISSEEGFGEYYEDNIVKYPLQTFKDQDYPDQMIALGELVPMQDEEGYPIDGVITEIDGEFITIDFNHPFAGRSLRYQGVVVGIRDATADEILQGVVKGAEGHN